MIAELGSGAARRRKERHLRSFLKHERMTVRMTLTHLLRPHPPPHPTQPTPHPPPPEHVCPTIDNVSGLTGAHFRLQRVPLVSIMVNAPLEPPLVGVVAA